MDQDWFSQICDWKDEDERGFKNDPVPIPPNMYFGDYLYVGTKETAESLGLKNGAGEYVFNHTMKKYQKRPWPFDIR